MYIRDYDQERFETYEEAYDALTEELSPRDLADVFHECIDFSELLQWAMTQPSFWNNSRFADAYETTMNEIFSDWFYEYDEEEDED